MKITDRKKFEEQRLLLFKEYGFDGQSGKVKDRNDKEIYYIENRSNEKPIILLHGGLSKASEWCQVANSIPGKVIIPDRPGFGLSYSLNYLDVDYRILAINYIEDLLNGLNLDQADFVVNSMGGFFLFAFTLAFPERVGRLVFVGAPVGIDKSIPLFPRLWGNIFLGKIVNRLQPNNPDEFREKILSKLLVANPENVPNQFIQVALAATRLPGVTQSSHTMLRNITTLLGLKSSVLIRDEVFRIKNSMLFIWGEEDKFAHPSSGRELCLKMENAEIKVVENSGHVMHLENPDTVSALVNEFLAINS